MNKIISTIEYSHSEIDSSTDSGGRDSTIE